MKAEAKKAITDSFNAIDQFIVQISLPVIQGAGLVDRLRDLAAKLNAIEVDAEPQPVENLIPIKKGGK